MLQNPIYSISPHNILELSIKVACHHFLSVESLLSSWLRGYGNVKDAQIAYSLDETLFTCKTFSISKALHVKTNIKPKEANCGLRIMVA